MKKLLPLFILSIIALASCNREKPFVITGTFNLPDSLEYGDTIVPRGSLEGMMVYLVDLGGEPIDSVIVENDTFKFEGKVSPKEPYLAYIGCEYLYGVIAIEAGEYSVCVGPQAIMAYGSPMNDGINDIDNGVEEIQQDIYDKMAKVVEAAGGYPSDSIMMPFYSAFNLKLENFLDSTYEANPENLIGLYAVNIKTLNAQTEDELDQILEPYNDYIVNSPLMKMRRDYFRDASAQMDYLQMLEGLDGPEGMENMAEEDDAEEEPEDSAK